MFEIPFWLNKNDFIKYGFIGNANAGPSRRKSNQKQLYHIKNFIAELNEAVTVEFGYENFITFIMTSCVREIAPSLRRLINEKKIKVLFVFGGDGSLHMALDILMYELFLEKRIDYIPIIASLGGGTMLAVHSWLGWNRNSFEIMKKIIYTDIEHLPIRLIRPLAITMKRSALEIETRFGFMFVMGVIARVIKKYDDEGRSIMAGIKHILQGISGSLIGWPKSHKDLAPNFLAEVFADGEKLPYDSLMSVICSVTHSLLFGMAPFRGNLASNQFFSLMSRLSSAHISTLVPLLYRGTINLPLSVIYNKPITELEIVPDKETLVFLDGNFYQATPGLPLGIKRGPAIKIISAF